MLETPLELPTAWGQLSGTLAWPDGSAPCTAVVLIAGSGPTDRDGNNPLLQIRIDNLKRVAQSLAARGVASLRYDKRGVGGSAFPGLSEEALRFEHLVDDAVLLAHRLAGESRVRHVVLAGHSEGALIALLAAPAAQAHAVVSLAGAGARASTLMRRQIEGHLPAELARAAFGTLDALEAQQPVPDVPDDLVLLFRPSVQPYLMSWFRHDPAEVLAALDLPVLLVHGARDAQVAPEHAGVLQAARPQARLRIVEGMDHLLAVQGDVGQGADAVAGELADWLQQIGAREPA
jgi:alpha-beta hydrolase superfamily lysophospholipase